MPNDPSTRLPGDDAPRGASDAPAGATASDARPVALFVAAGSGIAAAAARLAAERGWHVGILSSSGRGEALAGELGGVGVTGDARDDADLVRLVDGALERWGRIDAVVVGAGHGPKGELLALSDEDWHAGLDLYLLSVVKIARIVTPILARQGGGSIVNVSTFATFEPEADFPTSGVFRAGLAAFAKLFADRHAADGVRMNNVLPGFVDSLPERADRKERIPMGRYGRTAEIAEAILFLASGASSYVTGQNLRVDGGLTRSV